VILYPYSISFIIPALNEEVVLRTFIEQVLEKVEGKIAEFEIILINDGSTDATGKIMDELASRHRTISVIHNHRNLGFGNSYIRGLQRAKQTYVMLLCGDGGLPASSLPAIFDKIGSADIVIPWMVNLREIKSPARHLLSKTYTTLLNLLFGIRLHYYNGLPVHRLGFLKQLSITSGGFGFQAEILVKMIKSGCTYVEVGVNGAEETNRSSALRLRNWLSVAGTIGHLIKAIATFKPISVTPISLHTSSSDTSSDIAAK